MSSLVFNFEYNGKAHMGFFDYGNGEQERVTITLESRSAKGARAQAATKATV